MTEGTNPWVEPNSLFQGIRNAAGQVATQQRQNAPTGQQTPQGRTAARHGTGGGGGFSPMGALKRAVNPSGLVNFSPRDALEGAIRGTPALAGVGGFEDFDRGLDYLGEGGQGWELNLDDATKGRLGAFGDFLDTVSFGLTSPVTGMMDTAIANSSTPGASPQQQFIDASSNTDLAGLGQLAYLEQLQAFQNDQHALNQSFLHQGLGFAENDFNLANQAAQLNLNQLLHGNDIARQQIGVKQDLNSKNRGFAGRELDLALRGYGFDEQDLRRDEAGAQRARENQAVAAGAWGAPENRWRRNDLQDQLRTGLGRVDIGREGANLNYEQTLANLDAQSAGYGIALGDSYAQDSFGQQGHNITLGQNSSQYAQAQADLWYQIMAGDIANGAANFEWINSLPPELQAMYGIAQDVYGQGSGGGPANLPQLQTYYQNWLNAGNTGSFDEFIGGLNIQM